ncbi:MAG TPA: acyltransferase [Actinotalea sp.]
MTAVVISPAAASAATPRLEWVDAVRGFSVAAVVLFHVVLWDYGPVAQSVHPAGRAVWGVVNTMLGSVRMPVLLTVSGLVVAHRIRQESVVPGVLRRSLRNYYLYVVWLLVYAVFYAAFEAQYLRHRVGGPLDVVRQLLVPGTTLWYLLAIAVYILVLGVLRHVRPWVVLTALTLLSTAVHASDFPGQLWYKVPELFVFFAVGVYGSDLVRRLAEQATLARLGMAFLAAGGVTVLGSLAPDRITDAMLFLPRGVAFVALCVVAVTIAVRWAPVRRLGLALGRETLPVYVLHPLWIALTTMAVATWAGDPVVAFRGTVVGALLWPGLLTIAIIVLSLPARRFADRVHLSALFAMPPSWSRRLDALARSRPAEAPAGRPSPA